MNILGRIIKASMRLALAFLLIGALLNQAAYAVTINFDSVVASAGAVDATAYLAGSVSPAQMYFRKFSMNKNCLPAHL